MGKKLKLIPFLFKTLSSDSPPSWPWPSCSNQPKTLSFRAVPDIFKTANTVFSVEESSSGDDDEKAVLSGLRAKDRLFFEPGQTSSILESPLPPPPKQSKKKEVTPETAETSEMDSMDPVMDFRRSMEEMVEAHGMKDWDGLEELLGWYLSVNVKSNHGYIVGAFVDLIIGICSSEEEEEEELSESCSSLLSRSDEGDHDHHLHHHLHKVHNRNSMSTSISSHSPTSALSFSSSSTSSCSILPSSLQALIEADDVDQQKINASS